ncbi:hypothetical protein AB0D08_27005 [Kitasatospora sp. NPDC048540]|uniref:hypothetical protein n=1 Tax=unclassified Kitasatospora TaxID=2633591 RepID=UPI00053A3EBD|nr:hypothetical protein [Kitasatospora sp. MBT63]
MSTWEPALARLCAVPVPEDGSGELPDELFDAVEDLITAHGADDIAEIVAAAVHAGRTTVARASTFLNVATWSGTDNGASMRHTLNGWVRRADDTVRLHLALHHEAYPLPGAAEMRAVLPAIATRYPEHRAICEALLSTRPDD